jgi:hypothetical protein
MVKKLGTLCDMTSVVNHTLIFREKMNSGPLAPEVSSTVNFSDALSRMHTMRRPELTTMEEETSVDGILKFYIDYSQIKMITVFSNLFTHYYCQICANDRLRIAAICIKHHF